MRNFLMNGTNLRIDDAPIDLREIIDAELLSHAGDILHTDKVTIGGPPILLQATSAQAVALGIHELATNAVKYGALKQDSGKLSIAWRLEGETSADRRAVLDWRETGVVMEDEGRRPARKGYGTELIERALPYQLRAATKLEFTPDGVRCRIAAPVAPVRAKVD